MEAKKHYHTRTLSLEDISMINRALGIIEGVAYAVQDSGIAEGLASAIELIDAIIDKEGEEDGN